MLDITKLKFMKDRSKCIFMHINMYSSFCERVEGTQLLVFIYLFIYLLFFLHFHNSISTKAIYKAMQEVLKAADNLDCQKLSFKKAFRSFFKRIFFRHEIDGLSICPPIELRLQNLNTNKNFLIFQSSRSNSYVKRKLDLI